MALEVTPNQTGYTTSSTKKLDDENLEENVILKAINKKKKWTQRRIS